MKNSVKQKKKSVSYGNRGMFLEENIELANQQYKIKKVGLINKVPTPVKILKISSFGKVNGVITEKSTVDYVGVVKTRLGGSASVAFDAKETKNKSLSFDNIAEHQLEYMKSFSDMGGLSFIIVYFSSLDRYFRLSIEQIEDYIQRPYKTNKKSFPLRFFEKEGIEIKEEKGRPLHYLKGIV